MVDQPKLTTSPLRILAQTTIETKKKKKEKPTEGQETQKHGRHIWSLPK